MNVSRGLESFLKNLRKAMTSPDAGGNPVAVEELESRRLMSVSAQISGNSSVNEGNSYTLGLSGSATSPTPNLDHWSINWGDGSSPQTVAGNASNATHYYADGSASVQISASLVAYGTYPSTTYATSSVQTKNISVSDVAPVASLHSSQQAYAGDTFTITRSYSDVSADPATKYVIDWGDGTTPDTINSDQTTFVHVYADSGDYEISGHVWNKDINAAGPGVAMEGMECAVSKGYYFFGCTGEKSDAGGHYVGGGILSKRPTGVGPDVAVTLWMSAADAAKADVKDGEGNAMTPVTDGSGNVTYNFTTDATGSFSFRIVNKTTNNQVVTAIFGAPNTDDGQLIVTLGH